MSSSSRTCCAFLRHGLRKLGSLLSQGKKSRGGVAPVSTTMARAVLSAQDDIHSRVILRLTLAPWVHDFVDVAHGAVPSRAPTTVDNRQHDTSRVPPHAVVVVFRLLENVPNLQVFMSEARSRACGSLTICVDSAAWTSWCCSSHLERSQALINAPKRCRSR